jgi:hypothetical protein
VRTFVLRLASDCSLRNQSLSQREPDGARATDTVATSVLRNGEGCHNYAEPFDVTTYAAHVLEP